MAMSSGPFDAPADTADPGLARPVVALAMVFVVGMLCVGLIYAIGEPLDETAETVDTAVVEPAAEPAETPEATERTDTAPAPAEPAELYVSPGGESPMPRHGEAEAPPIPPATLIDEAGLDAQQTEASTLPQPDGPVAWDKAHQYLERVISVRGTIVDTNNIGNICFLNYDPDWEDKFYIAMFKEAFELLPDPPEEHYLNKTLLVKGKVTLHQGRPQIQVYDVSQIEVVE